MTENIPQQITNYNHIESPSINKTDITASGTTK